MVNGPPAGTGSLADALFTPVQQRVLGLLFGQPARRFQSAELIRLAGAGTGATHRLLKRLAHSGLVRATTSGRQTYYQANGESPIFEELAGLVRKTMGLAILVREALAPLRDRIEMAFIYGSVADGSDRADSDIDVMIIAEDLDYSILFDALQEAEQQLGRRISPKLMRPADWRRKRAQPNTLAARIQDRPRLPVIGSDDGLQ